MNHPMGSTESVPPIEPLDFGGLPAGTTYVGAVGFEDRALAFLQAAQDAGISDRLDRAVAIEYLPFNRRNRLEEYHHLLAEHGLSGDLTRRVVYDRYEPGDFAGQLRAATNEGRWGGHVLVDMTAMSKLLIVLLAQELRKCHCPVTFAYGEAGLYHPEREQFEADKPNIPERTPGYLTTDVYRVVTTSAVSSVAMAGYPLMMIAFPTFNYKELLALANEFTPHELVFLEGTPHEEHNLWRLDAIQWINRKLRQDTADRIQLSTFEYRETVEALEEVYRKHRYTHKIIVAPTGSKLQALGVWVFRQMHPDVQIVYPITTEFASAYSEGCKALWGIHVPDLSEFAAGLGQYRKAGLKALDEAIEAARK